MKIPPDAIIADDKLINYLLVVKPRNDKSKFLGALGYTQQNPEALKTALRNLTDEVDAVVEKTTDYGTSYHIKGSLRGVEKGELAVILVWFQRLSDNLFYFVTLKPDKEES